MTTTPTSMQQLFLLGAQQLELRTMPVPALAPGECLLRVDAATTCGTDVKVFRRGGHPKMLKVPGPFGHEVCGTVIALGEGSAVEVGDEVVVANSASCDRCVQCQRGRRNLCVDLQYLNGAFSDFLVLPQRFVERSVFPRPQSLEPVLAALAEPLACALHCVQRLEQIWCGEGRSLLGARCLIAGGGALGLVLTGLLRDRGVEVTVLDPHDDRLDEARHFGARHAVQAHRDDRDTRAALKLLSPGTGFDLAVDATGSPVAWQNLVAATGEGAAVAFFGGCAPGTSVTIDPHQVHYAEAALLGVYHYRLEHFREALRELADKGERYRRLISGEIGLEEIPEGLEKMLRREAFKLAVRPHG